MIDFKELQKNNQTLIYKEKENKKEENGWEFWSKRVENGNTVYVFRKVVSFQDAEEYENALHN